MATQHHTAPFRLGPQLAKALSEPTPAVRKPGSVWTEPRRPVRAGAEPVGHVRLDYARASPPWQSLDAQLDSLGEAGVIRVFSEKISTRAAKRPELEAAVKLAGEIRSSGVAVTLVVHEHKRLGRGIELAMLAVELKASDVGLEVLAGELKGSHDPSGVVFTVLAAVSGMEREHVRDRTLEGHESTSPRVHGSTGPRVHGSTGPRVHGSTGPRVHGSTGPRGSVARPSTGCRGHRRRQAVALNQALRLGPHSRGAWGGLRRTTGACAAVLPASPGRREML
ncbi:recombinase family protein [Streptomyces sp. NPDC056682]|uniref:recombinase family protein n=1 Tax=Streptomyces sp. NPDC056682 TaxID=3345909 RepID=UPI00369FF203